MTQLKTINNAYKSQQINNSLTKHYISFKIKKKEDSKLTDFYVLNTLKRIFENNLIQGNPVTAPIVFFYCDPIFLDQIANDLDIRLKKTLANDFDYTFKITEHY